MPKTANSNGFISIMVILFLLLFSVLLSPASFLKFQSQVGNPGDTTTAGCVVGEKPTFEYKLTLPAIKNRDMDDDETGDKFKVDRDIFGPDETSQATFKLVRLNALMEKTPVFGGGDSEEKGSHSTKYKENFPVTYPGQQPQNFAIYYPTAYGEMNLDIKIVTNFNPPYQAKGRDKTINQYRFRQEGYIYFVKLGPDLKPLESNGNYIVDLYQDEEIINLNRPYNSEKIFLCQLTKDGQPISPTNSSSQFAKPNQNDSQEQNQLQLGWFVIQSNQTSLEGAKMAVHCKPAVYLYPPNPMLINVKVYPAGFLTYTDPIYDVKTGWNVLAYPSGKLALSDKNTKLGLFDYLYFESKIKDEVIEKPDKGWVVGSGSVGKQGERVKGEGESWFSPLNDFFRKILPKLGLNQRQTKDFIDYWSKALPYSPYYFVGVIDESKVNKIERLEITPKPDRIKRIRIYFERLSTSKQVTAPILSSSLLTLSPSPSFRVVEWGGMVKQDKDHPFTCSQ